MARGQCPKCDTADPVPVLYGYPAFDETLDRELEAGNIVLGGCVVGPSSRAWQCRNCKTEFGRYVEEQTAVQRSLDSLLVAPDQTAADAQTSAFDRGVERAIRTVLNRHPGLRDHRKKFPWLTGHLGEPASKVWFVAWYPSREKAGRVGDARDPEKQWSVSRGDHLFREALVHAGFKVGGPLAPGGWHCYITNLIKADHDVRQFKDLSEREQGELAALWAPVLEWEIANGGAGLLVPMGDAVRRLLPHALARVQTRRPEVYPNKVWHYATFNYGPVGESQRQTYLAQFDSIARYWRLRDT